MAINWGIRPSFEQKRKGKELDLQTTAGLIQFGQERGVDIKEPTRRRGFLGGIQRFAEAISIGEFAVGGLLSGRGIQAGIKEKISPSDILLGEGDPKATRAAKIVRGALGLAIDVAFDPTTYLTLGVGGAIKLTTKAGAKVFLSKTGKGMLKELSQEIGEKAARQKTAEMAIMKGNERLLAKTGLKWAGFEILPASKLKAPFRFIGDALNATKAGRAFVGSLEKTGKSVAGLFNRDYGLDELSRKNKQRLLDGIEEARIDTAEEIKVIFGGVAGSRVSNKQREAIAFAIEGGEEAIKNLDKPLQKITQRVKQVFETLHKEEERLGLMNHWQKDYVTHLYRNIEEARRVFGSLAIDEIKPSGFLRFSIRRSIPTLTEAQKLGLDPITDIAVILNVRMVASEKAKLMQKFFYDTVETKGIKGFAKVFAGEGKKVVEPTVDKGIKMLKPMNKGARKLNLDDAIRRAEEQFQASKRPEITDPEELLRFIDREGSGNVGVFLSKNEMKTLGKFLQSIVDPENIKLRGIITEPKFPAANSSRDLIIGKIGDNFIVVAESGFGAGKVRIHSTPFAISQDKIVGRIDLKKFLKEGIGKTELPKIAKVKVAAKVVPKTLPRKVLELGENPERLGKFAHGVPDDIRNVLIPAHIGRDIVKMNKRLFVDPDLNYILRQYDKGLNFFKGSVTVMFPAFHGRNAISNVLQNFLDIGVQAINPLRHVEAIKVMTSSTGGIVTDLGTKYTYKEVRALAKKNGVLTNKVTRIDIQRSLASNPIERATPFGIGRNLGRKIENEARMVNFITNLRRGFDPEDAAAKTKEFLFDYDNLTMLEKDYLRRLIPFYTWTRKNIALQLKATATVPGKQVAQFKALRAMEEMFGESKDEDEKKFAPDFVMAGMNILLNRKDDDRTFLVGFDLPIESAFDFLSKPLREMLISLSPFLKAPLEFATQRNFFKEKQIKEDDSGKTFETSPQFLKNWLEYKEKVVKPKGKKEFKIQTVNPWKKWTLQQVETFMGIGRVHSQGFIEPIISTHRMLLGEEKITVEDKWNVIRFFTGLRAFTIDIEASKRLHEKNDVRGLLDILERNGVMGRMEISFPSKED